MAFVVQLVSPEHVLYEGEAEMVVCRTTDGEIAFASLMENEQGSVIGVTGADPVSSPGSRASGSSKSST